MDPMIIDVYQHNCSVSQPLSDLEKLKYSINILQSVIHFCYSEKSHRVDIKIKHFVPCLMFDDVNF